MMRKSELLAVVAAMAAVAAFGQDQAPGQVQDDPPSRVARLNYMSGTVSFRPGSVDEWTAAILNLDDRMAQLSLTGGALHVRLRSLGEGESFEVDTPNAAVTLLRAGEYRFFVDGDHNLTTVTVRGGDAEVTGGGRGR